MNRRGLFSFLALSPVVAVGAMARATIPEPREISADKINLGNDYELVAGSEGNLRLGHKQIPECSVTFMPK